jgi:hypothetical protein
MHLNHADRNLAPRTSPSSEAPGGGDRVDGDALRCRCGSDPMPVPRVFVALTAGRNISPTFSNFDEKPGANGFQNKAGFIEVSWDQGCDPLVLFAVGWQFLRGSSPCLPANTSRALREGPAPAAHRLAARPDAASTASLVPRCALAPAARGSCLDYFGRLLAPRTRAGRHRWFSLEPDPRRNKVALLYSYP